MIDYIKGMVTGAGEGTVTVEDRSGVGYLLNVSSNTASDLSSANDESIVYTHLAVRENDVSLYGFSTVLERKLFYMLLTVPKIVPKIALNILGAFSPNALISTVLQRDVKTLTVANGVGKKAAEQIVVTLHDKFEKLGDEESTVEVSSGEAGGTLYDDAVLALTSLGFDMQTATATVRSVADDTMSLEDIIASSLRALNR